MNQQESKATVIFTGMDILTRELLETQIKQASEQLRGQLCPTWLNIPVPLYI